MFEETGTAKISPSSEGTTGSTTPPTPEEKNVERKVETTEEKSAPAKRKLSIPRLIDTASKGAQIIALIIAAAWAWIGFEQNVAPSLEPKLGIDSELHWAAVTDEDQKGKAQKSANEDVCEANFFVKVNDPGKGPFDVDTVTVKAWLVPLGEYGLYPDVIHPKDFDPRTLPDEKAFYNKNNPAIAGELIGHYSEGVDNSGSFHFFFKRTTKTLAVFVTRVDGTRPWSYWPLLSYLKAPTDNYTYQIDQVCGGKWDEKAEKSNQDKGNKK